MIAQLELQIYHDLVAYLSDKIPLADFRRDFDAASWDVNEWDSDLLSQIELLFAEFSNGHRTEADLKEALKSSMPTLTLHIEPIADVAASASVETGATNLVRTIRPLSMAGILDLYVGKLREEEYA
ncbi:MAG TPA: hypothetical protein VHV29_09950 [Terriglobales bacterium]|jgi:hypothetical protein|nr:hypothetical protein [Terriglobales bacterium]